MRASQATRGRATKGTSGSEYDHDLLESSKTRANWKYRPASGVLRTAPTANAIHQPRDLMPISANGASDGFRSTKALGYDQSSAPATAALIYMAGLL